MTRTPETARALAEAILKAASATAAPAPRKPPRPLAPCGTRAAATRHYRRGESLDEACRQAVRDDARGRGEARRVERAARVASLLAAWLPSGDRGLA